MGMIDLSFGLKALTHNDFGREVWNQAPKFTIVLPLGNHAATLREAIASVQGQTLADFELIIVDTGSDDGSLAIAAAAAALDPRIILCPAKADSLSAARNIAAGLAEAELIAFMEGSTVWAKDKLERHFALHRVQPQMAASYARIGKVSAQSGHILPIPHGNPWRSASLRMVDVLGEYPVLRISNLVISRDWFRRMGGLDQTLFYAGDQDLVARVVQAGGQVNGVDAALTAQTGHPQQARPEAQNIYANWLEIARRYLRKGQQAELEALCCRTVARHALRMGESPFVAIQFIRQGLRIQAGAFLNDRKRAAGLMLATAISLFLTPALRRKLFA